MATWKDLAKAAQAEFYSGPGYIPDSLEGRYQKEFNNSLRANMYDPYSESNLATRMLNNLALRDFGRKTSEIPTTLVNLVGGIGGAIGGGLGGGEWKKGFLSGWNDTDRTFGDWWRYARDYYADKLGITKLMDADYNDADKKMRELYIGPEKDERGQYTDRYKQYMKDADTMKSLASGIGTTGSTLVSWPAFGAVFKGMGDVVGLGVKGVGAGANATGNLAMKAPAVAKTVDSARRVMAPVASKARTVWNATKNVAAPIASAAAGYLGKAKAAIEPVMRYVRPVAGFAERAATHPATISTAAGVTDGLYTGARATQRTTADKFNNIVEVLVGEYNDAIDRRDRDAWETACKRLDIVWPEWREANPNAPAPELPPIEGVPWHDLKKPQGYAGTL